MRSKRGAMEMSVGTIVTIVLLMSVLILGIFLVQKVFSSGTSAVDQIDTKLQSQIDSLFADEGKKITIIPKPQEGGVKLKQGESGGFALMISNKDMATHTFEYNVAYFQKAEGCQMTEEQSNKLIILGRNAKGITLGSGQSMEEAILVKYSIPETAPLCQVRYKVDVLYDGQPYASSLVDLTII